MSDGSSISRSRDKILQDVVWVEGSKIRGSLNGVEKLYRAWGKRRKRKEKRIRG